MKKIYLEKTEEVNFDDLTEREKLIYKSGQETPPILGLILIGLACMLLGAFINEAFPNFIH